MNLIANIGSGKTARKEMRQALAQAKEPVKPPEPVRVRPSFAAIMTQFMFGMSQGGAKNPSSEHSRIPGHKSKKFKGYDRENRRFNSFKKRIR